MSISHRGAAFLAAGALIVLVAASGAYFGYADPLGDSPIKESTKSGPDPETEPEYYPDPTFSGPSATPRPCPECFAKPLPKPSPGSPCPQRPLVAAAEVDYSRIRDIPADAWLEYVSPNYGFSFRYPPTWKIEVYNNNVYAWPDADGVISGERISGPVTESIQIFNPEWAAQLGPQMGGDPGSGAAKIEIVVGPSRAAKPCEPAAEGNPKRAQLQVGGVEASATINVVEPPLSYPPLYVVTVTRDPTPLQNLVAQGYSYGDPAGLEILKALLFSMRFGQ